MRFSRHKCRKVEILGVEFIMETSGLRVDLAYNPDPVLYLAAQKRLLFVRRVINFFWVVCYEQTKRINYESYVIYLESPIGDP